MANWGVQILLDALAVPDQEWYTDEYGVVNGSPREARDFIRAHYAPEVVKAEISTDRTMLIVSCKNPCTFGFVQNALNEEGFGLRSGNMYYEPSKAE